MELEAKWGGEINREERSDGVRGGMRRNDEIQKRRTEERKE